ncbi:hypothetical protein GGTG_00457 [Gaeumannomyces tritici R3-111a-1]|uniref:Sterol regulatory element-binding protein cleavage-activating protein n=1 Tax=Gaeumannomyces tritici (strain R3-111a-1) TaxID=644352 RepID=J3NGR8_GAET3|nr:hypothetical protein GGTG_00457 [Gaeumannomyces tritici R3-111a-1]EJT80458.1 hypothetical protein GGTG_00457 [Gaeumannomyces tritici R3-111a-1]
MLWYLLYPLRGTTEAPNLAPDHPFRNWPARYGRYVARHVDTVLLLAVAVAGILLYPFPFLYTTDFTNSASNLPHHVWTNAQPLSTRADLEPDVIMRTVWVHGSYMRALDRDVLLGALQIQNELLGSTKDFNPRRPVPLAAITGLPNGDLTQHERDTFHVINGRTNMSWFYHSPLQYWSGDAQKIFNDKDIIGTVNARKTQSTSVNVTLRHSIVFSGKRFEDRKLVAADALVITLIHLRDSPVGRQWERKTAALAARMADRWTAYPRDGRSMPSQLYEFQFRPISFWDLTMLSLAYFLTFMYFLHSLSKLRAVKSKAGLIVTLVVQIVASVISSFTVCAVFKVDLSKIPQACFPLVVWSMSLENMFRLINAVIVTPSEDSTSSRIGQAFGETFLVSFTSVLQYLLIILGLSRVVLPGVSAFCTFAAIATLFDFFYLSTFFLSVLSVEVRRTELSEALAKSSLRHNRSSSQAPYRKSWTEALLQGKIALSTRIAGLIVTLGFILVAQWHFSQTETLLHTLGKMFRDRAKSETAPLLIDIHQARGPTSWLRLQDHETAREVIHVVKPWAHSYVARVYDPLVFVMKGSNRTPPARERSLSPAVYDFAHHQTVPLIIAIIVVVSLVRLLMNYLLWDEIAGGRSGEYGGEDEQLISIKTVNSGHALDVALMAATPDGRVVSAGLDRMIWVWNVRFLGTSYVVTSPDKSGRDPFPVLAMAIDDSSEWLVLLSSSKIWIWDLKARKWGPVVEVDLRGQKPDALFFSTRKSREARMSIVVIRRNGTMVETWPDLGQSQEYVVCKSPLSCAVPLADRADSNQATSFLTLSRRGCIHKGTTVGDVWLTEEVRLPSDESDIQAVLAVPDYSSYLVARTSSVDLVDFHSSSIIYTFRTEVIRPRTLSFFHSHPRKTQTGAKGLRSFTLVYIKADGGECVIQTYLPSVEGETISFRDDELSLTRGCSWQDASEIRRTVENPGLWASLPSGCVVGIRQKPPKQPLPQPTQPPAPGSLRRRRATPPLRPSDPSDRSDDLYEVWTMTQLEKKGAYATRPLVSDGFGDEYEAQPQDHLMISEPGPIVKVGRGSIAAAFGNTIRIITIGHESFSGGLPDEDRVNRRRRAGGSFRNKAPGHSPAKIPPGSRGF